MKLFDKSRGPLTSCGSQSEQMLQEVNIVRPQQNNTAFSIHACSNFSNNPHPELRSGLLQGLGGGVQGAPPVGQLRLSPLPALQKQRRPHDIEEGKNHTADILTGL